MGKIKRIAGIGAVVIILGLVILGIALSSMINHVIQAGVETGGSEVTGTAVTLQSAKVSPLSGSGELTELVIGNPEGFKTDRAFRLGKVALDLEPFSVLSNVVTVNNISIDGAEVTLELGTRGTNIQAILRHIESLGAGPAEPASETRFVIHQFVMRNTKVRMGATMTGGKTIDFDLPEIVLTELGEKSEGQTIDELAPQIFRPVGKAIQEAATDRQQLLQRGKQIITEKAALLKEKAKDAVESVKELFDR